MNREVYEQLDRMEQKIDYVLREAMISKDEDSYNTLTGWYEEEIQNEKGELVHLKDDKKLNAFMDKLKEDFNNELELDIENEEYRQS